MCFVVSWQLFQNSRCEIPEFFSEQEETLWVLKHMLNFDGHVKRCIQTGWKLERQSEMDKDDIADPELVILRYLSIEEHSSMAKIVYSDFLLKQKYRSWFGFVGFGRISKGYVKLAGIY